ncbi:hypothetical protein E2C01_015110 [Portunus trituberculatus]|uniref:Uncharacterized protein n=1 Tax=Portunus trituberculatus TaxID=210409 RepID=A0A5B7DLP4_PORTR|nr:hypothetical protein [Portunus trituberculatus]
MGGGGPGVDTPVGLRLVTPELRRTWKLIRRGAAASPAQKGVSPVSAAAAIRQSCVFPAPTADGGAGSSPSLGVDTVTVSPRRPYIPLLQSFLKLYVLAVLWRPFEFAVQFTQKFSSGRGGGWRDRQVLCPVSRGYKAFLFSSNLERLSVLPVSKPLAELRQAAVQFRVHLIGFCTMYSPCLSSSLPWISSYIKCKAATT